MAGCHNMWLDTKVKDGIVEKQCEQWTKPLLVGLYKGLHYPQEIAGPMISVYENPLVSLIPGGGS